MNSDCSFTNTVTPYAKVILIKTASISNVENCRSTLTVLNFNQVKGIIFTFFDAVPSNQLSSWAYTSLSSQKIAWEANDNNLYNENRLYPDVSAVFSSFKQLDYTKKIKYYGAITGSNSDGSFGRPFLKDDILYVPGDGLFFDYDFSSHYFDVDFLTATYRFDFVMLLVFAPGYTRREIKLTMSPTSTVCIYGYEIYRSSRYYWQGISCSDTGFTKIRVTVTSSFFITVREIELYDLKKPDPETTTQTITTVEPTTMAETTTIPLTTTLPIAQSNYVKVIKGKSFKEFPNNKKLSNKSIQGCYESCNNTLNCNAFAYDFSTEICILNFPPTDPFDNSNYIDGCCVFPIDRLEQIKTDCQ